MNSIDVSVVRVTRNDTFTSSIHVRGTDGSYITMHEVGHETFDKNGNPVVQFDRPTLTCG